MTSAWKRVLIASGLSALAIAAAYHYVQPSRYVVFITYTVLFALFAYFVVVLRGRLRDVALVFASLFFGLVAIELVVWRVSDAPITYKEKGSWAPMPELGWSPARPGPIHEKKVAANGDIIFDVVNTIDDHLMRKVDSASSGPSIIFFGDSMTFGVGVNDVDTLPQAFADLTNRKYRVLNMAVAAYGPQQFLRALEIGHQDALLKQDPRLFIMLTAPWHAARTACVANNTWFAPSYMLKDGAPVFSGPCSARATGVSGALKSLFRSTEAFRFFFERERPMEKADIDLYLAILIRAGELAREKYGVPTLILYLPDALESERYRLGPGYSNEDLMRRLREGGLLVMNAAIDFAAYPENSLLIVGDGHPTPLAHRIWAERLKDYVEKDFGGLAEKKASD